MKVRYLLLLIFAIVQVPCIAQQSIPVTVTVQQGTGRLEIRNGLLGIVLPAAGVVKNESEIQAPIQSFIYADGTYSDNTANFIITPGKLSYRKLNIVENSPAKVVVRQEYWFDKKVFKIKKDNNAPPTPGPGYFFCTITVERGSKSIIIEDESNYDLTYRVKISNGLNPDQARYRGWGSYSVDAGHEPDGRLYRDVESRGYPMDAIVDVGYDKFFSFRRIIMWEPAGGEWNSGRYWQMYNTRAGTKANLFGIYQGPPSRMIMAGNLGPSLMVFTEDPANKEPRDAEINLDINQVWPVDHWTPRKRYQWCVYISTKADLPAPDKPQPIGLELNRVSGLAAVIKKYATDPVNIIPAFYKGAIYMPASEVATLRNKIKSDDHFYREMCGMESFYKPIFDAWRFKDSARSLLNQLLTISDTLIYHHLYGEGSYTNIYRYWKGARMYKFFALSASALFSDDQFVMTADQKRKLELLIGLMGRIVWDDNNVPLFDSAGVNMGPSNMAFQYRNNARIFFALLLANDPAFKNRAGEVIRYLDKDIKEAIFENGSTFGTPHYSQATIDPILFTLLQVRQAGVKGTEKWKDRIQRLAEFYMQLNTPASVRFSRNRKLISFGDGSEESAATFGLLYTLLKEPNPALANQLLAVFHKGPARSSFAGPVMFAVDMLKVPDEPLLLANANYDGYFSGFRSGANTPLENAAWLLNGDSLWDHRNDDAGELAMYALGAPLSLSRSSFYYPSATDSRIRSVVVPEALFPEWNKAEQPIAGRSLTNRTWPASSQQEFINFGNIATSRVKMSTPDGKAWFRSVTAIAVHDDQPVYLVYDSVSGGESNIWNMMMMSEGAVGTPTGPVKPENRVHNSRDLLQVPSATPVAKIAAGWNHFDFTGQQWKLHPAGGIDWMVYNYSKEPSRFTLASWTNSFQSPVEASEFRQSTGSNYSETQQILRIQSARPFLNIILPYQKRSDLYKGNRLKTNSDGSLTVYQGEDEIRMMPVGITLKNSSSQSLIRLAEGQALWSDKKDFKAEGGALYATWSGNRLIVRVHGTSGSRKISLNGKKVSSKTRIKGVEINNSSLGSVITISYQSNGNNLRPGQTGYTEYQFIIN